MKKIACLQHLAEEGPGALADWALRRDVAIELFRGDLGQLPTHGDYDAYVLLGGPFDAVGADCPSWLEQEKAWLGNVLRMAKPVLGICLGGQLLADRLGAQVAPIDHPEGDGARWRSSGMVRMTGITCRYCSGTNVVLRCRLGPGIWPGDQTGKTRLTQSAMG